MKDLLWNKSKLIFKRGEKRKIHCLPPYVNWMSEHRKLIGLTPGFHLILHSLSTASASQGQRGVGVGVGGEATLLPSFSSKSWLPLVPCQQGHLGEMINDPGEPLPALSSDPEFLTHLPSSYCLIYRETHHFAQNGRVSKSLLNPPAITRRSMGVT